MERLLLVGELVLLLLEEKKVPTGDGEKDPLFRTVAAEAFFSRNVVY